MRVDSTNPTAVRTPAAYAGAGDACARAARLQAEFGPLLRVGRIFIRNQGSEHFITGNPHDTLFEPVGSPNAGQPRYEWRDRGDGVLHGYPLL